MKAWNSRAPSRMTNIVTDILYPENNVTDFLPMTDSAVQAHKYTQWSEEGKIACWYSRDMNYRNLANADSRCRFSFVFVWFRTLCKSDLGPICSWPLTLNLMSELNILYKQISRLFCQNRYHKKLMYFMMRSGKIH